MDVVWQDSGASFLDSAGTDPSSFASFASDGTLWTSSGDSPLFSGQPVLWESGADAPADSPISGLTADSAGGTDPSPLLVGSWTADVGSAFAGATSALDGGLLWTAAGSDTSNSLVSNGGVGLGALDLGASSGASLWQHFVDQFAGGFGIGPTDVPQLLWTGTGSQPSIAVPVPVAAQSLPLAASDSSPLATVGNLAPAPFLWTPSLGATGLTPSPSLMTGAGAVGSSSSNLPLAGAGSHA
jgi:hypothetical protein